MTRKELIAKAADHTKLPKSDVERVLYAVFDKIIPNTLAEGTAVSINDFGKFEPVTKKARTGRNPQTGAAIEVPEKGSVRFKLASKLKEVMN